jgi:hypothetical protein
MSMSHEEWFVGGGCALILIGAQPFVLALILLYISRGETRNIEPWRISKKISLVNYMVDLLANSAI